MGQALVGALGTLGEVAGRALLLAAARALAGPLVLLVAALPILIPVLVPILISVLVAPLVLGVLRLLALGRVLPGLAGFGTGLWA